MTLPVDFDTCPHCGEGELVLCDPCDDWRFTCTACGRVTHWSDAFFALLLEAGA